MLRWLAGIMILWGSMGLGLWYRQQFALRLKNVRLMQGILELLMSEIRYGKTSLPECCRRVGLRQQEPFRSSFLRIYRQMEENGGESFPGIFCREMEKCLGSLPVTGEDREAFLAFAREQSFEDGRMQLRVLERSGGLLESTARRLAEENREKGRLAVGLGAMSGLLLVIVLL